MFFLIFILFLSIIGEFREKRNCNNIKCSIQAEKVENERKKKKQNKVTNRKKNSLEFG